LLVGNGNFCCSKRLSQPSSCNKEYKISKQKKLSLYILNKDGLADVQDDFIINAIIELERGIEEDTMDRRCTHYRVAHHRP
jgi:hypothetical protein